MSGSGFGGAPGWSRTTWTNSTHRMNCTDCTTPLADTTVGRATLSWASTPALQMMKMGRVCYFAGSSTSCEQIYNGLQKCTNTRHENHLALQCTFHITQQLRRTSRLGPEVIDLASFELVKKWAWPAAKVLRRLNVLFFHMLGSFLIAVVQISLETAQTMQAKQSVLVQAKAKIGGPNSFWNLWRGKSSYSRSLSNKQKYSKIKVSANLEGFKCRQRPAPAKSPSPIQPQWDETCDCGEGSRLPMWRTTWSQDKWY